jgi:hypothetical protein
MEIPALVIPHRSHADEFAQPFLGTPVPEVAPTHADPLEGNPGFSVPDGCLASGWGHEAAVAD